MAMNYITFRSATPAQRGQRVLKEAGIVCSLQRTPRYLQEKGCSYCLRVRPEQTLSASRALHHAEVAFSRIYTEQGQIWGAEL